MSQLPLFSPSLPRILSCFEAEASIVVHEGDALAFAQSLPSDLAKLIMTSPPYNIGKSYETRTGLKQYLQEQKSLISELVRILHDEGSLCWQVGNYIENGEVFPLDMYYYDIFKDAGLKLRNRIIWYFGHGLHAKKRFSGRYETILWFTKSDTYTFNLDDVRIPSKYPGKRHYKGDKRGQPSGNPLGKNPTDIWEFVAQDWDRELWDIPNVKNNHPEKTDHPCQYPVELVERCVLALTNQDDWVYDPYVGVGSSMLAALKHNRRVLGSDRDFEYVSVARDRIKRFYRGELKLRPLGKSVYQPSGNEKITQIPSEWAE